MPTTPAVRRHLLAPAFVIAVALFAVPAASALPSVATAERHTLRQEEHRARREQRLEEAEARRSGREERRAARELARRERLAARHDGSAAGEAPSSRQGSADGDCAVTLAAASTRVLVGESASLSGTVTCSAGVAATPAHVDVYERSGPAGLGAKALAQSAATTKGNFTMTSAPLTASTVFVARIGHRHARVAVQAAPAVTLSAAPAPSDAGVASRLPRTKIAFSGSVTPAVGGELVALQVCHAATGERWRSIGWTHTAADGSYTLDHVLRTPGVTAVRTIVHPGDHLGVGLSETLSLQGSQPQQAALTIAASADPIVSGQAVGISGVLAGGSNAPVKLLARTLQGPFAVVAEGVTDEHGDYSFEQSPAEATVYRVTSGTTSSTGLREEVAFALVPAPAPATASVGDPVEFTGTLTPAAAGQPVVLERRGRSGVGFEPIAQGTVGAPPSYSVSFAFAKAGEYVLRLRAPGDGTHQGTTSAPFVLAVSG